MDSWGRIFQKERIAGAKTLGHEHGWRTWEEQQGGSCGQGRLGDLGEVTRRSKRWSEPGHIGPVVPCKDVGFFSE